MAYQITQEPTHGTLNHSAGEETPLVAHVVYSPSSNYSGRDSFKVKVKDNEGAWSSEGEMVIDVGNVNDPPQNLVPIPSQTIEEGANFSSFNLDTYFSDIDNSNDELTFSVEGNHDLSVQISPDHIATITAPNTDWNGSEAITFVARDPFNESTLSNPVPVFTVTPVNDPPVINPRIPDQTIDEGGSFAPISLNEYVSDIETSDSELQVNFTGANNLSVLIDPATHVAIVSIPTSTWNGDETISFTVSDGEASTNQEVKFKV